MSGNRGKRCNRAFSNAKSVNEIHKTNALSPTAPPIAAIEL